MPTVGPDAREILLSIKITGDVIINRDNENAQRNDPAAVELFRRLARSGKSSRLFGKLRARAPAHVCLRTNGGDVSRVNRREKMRVVLCLSTVRLHLVNG